MSTLKSPLEMYIVEVVKGIRKSQKINQEDIASTLGVTVGYIGQIESKKLKSMYSYDQLNKLAKFFGCSPKDFMPEKPL